MKRVATANPQLQHESGFVPVMLVEDGDQFPELGPSVGIDTETELITDANLAPPLSVLGVYDAEHHVCYIVQWPMARWFMRELCIREIEQRYFNLGFDEQVLCNEDPDERPLVSAISADRVVDMQIRIHLRELATRGWIRHDLYSLAGCSMALLNKEMDKGDGTESSDRLSFKRTDAEGRPYVPTASQCEYLAMDCITTWALGEAVGPQATETAHTKGMCVLAHISSNGFPVDRKVWDHFEHKLIEDRDKHLKELIGFGFPDPGRKNVSEIREAQSRLVVAVNGFQAAMGLNSRLPEDYVFGKNQLRRAVMYLWNHDGEPSEREDCARNVMTVLFNPNRALRKQEQAFWDEMCEDKDLLAFDNASKATAMVMLTALLIEDYTMQLPAEGGFRFDEALKHAGEQLDDNPSWTSNVPKIGPRKFFVSYVEMLEQRTGIQLERTELSGEPQLTKKDMWRLEDAGVEDKFLSAYTDYGHCVKYLSTYLNPEFIKSDGRVHARYTNLLKTGRTSCNSPNLQQLPSRDSAYPLKLMYRAPEGMLLCSTDYSFVELCAFGQACYTRFGHSVMRDVINAGLDPHRWFAGVMHKIITPDLSKAGDAEWVKATSVYLKEHVSDEQRQGAKMANFGLPGGMGYDAFYRHCREGGLKVTKKDTDYMRDAWISTFSEMRQHMEPEQVRSTDTVGRQFGFDDEDPDDDQERVGKLYVARCINGFVRNRASRTAACNAQFQSLVAYGAKLAGWRLVESGYQDRLLNFVHDEYIYCLYPDELETRVPEIERLMLEGMAIAIPDVKVKVETTVGIHWDKHATEFAKLDKNASGRYIIDEPPLIAEIYGQSPS